MPHPASSTRCPARLDTGHPVFSSNMSRLRDVPFAESNCAFEKVFHWKPKDPT
jgi:hypothetical protein